MIPLKDSFKESSKAEKSFVSQKVKEMTLMDFAEEKTKVLPRHRGLDQGRRVTN